jgi:hypothetical protein
VERFEFKQDADEAAELSEHGPWVRYSDYEKLEAAQREPQAGVMHPVDQAFYDLVVKERDAERQRVDRLEAQRNQARQEVLEEVATEFEREAEKYARKRAECTAAEKRDQALGKLAKGHTYKATWNYYEGLAKAYELAASTCREKAAALKGDSDANH